MGVYKYMAKSQTGEVIKGNFEAESKKKLTDILHEKNLLILDIKEFRFPNKNKFKKKRVSYKDLAVFCRQFHTMYNSGINILDCMFILKNQVSSLRFSSAIEKIIQSIRKGNSLKESMEEHKDIFPNILISMIDVGETGGNLSSSLERMAVYFEKENKIRQKIKTAMAYPFLISFITFAVVIFLMLFVIPMFVEMYSDTEAILPFPTRILVYFSKNMIEIITYFIIFLLSIFVLIKHFKSTSKGKIFIDNFFLKVPFLNLYIKKIFSFRFSRTLSELLYANVSLVESLKLCSNILNNSVFSNKINRVVESISLGSTLAGPLETMNLFPSMVIKMIKTGEESGTLDSMLLKVSQYHDEELDSAITRLIAFVEPLMIAVIALIVGFIVIGMVLPIFTSYQHIV
ncbi:type II secretion system F family protein [Herbivorax sp. ANBcel31]|uniref:type II secretion system F family protein n=1 Tax=Herbivorax sp. ANBcel31 TaxID=3069754 RepID=UPI0027B7EB63|nr:type II secretion system F family protein [Herbivorax sp. ANBcel31]MDQ2087833.1 type II secretion system F family protein [Herbivorax sp. ANBcel31]